MSRQTTIRLKNSINFDEGWLSFKRCLELYPNLESVVYKENGKYRTSKDGAWLIDSNGYRNWYNDEIPFVKTKLWELLNNKD